MIVTRKHVVHFFNTRKSETFCGMYHCIFLSVSLLSSILQNLQIKKSTSNKIKTVKCLKKLIVEENKFTICPMFHSTKLLSKLSTNTVFKYKNC